MALNRNADWWRVLHLPPNEYLIASVVVQEAQRLHVQELQALADRTAHQTANDLGPLLGKLIKSLAKAMNR